MNNHGLLAGLLGVALLSAGVYADGKEQKVITLNELFEIAETNSVQLRPSFTAEEEAQREISVARSQKLPEITTTLSLSYIGDGFTTRRNFSDYQKATIPHFENGFGVSVNQPVYTGGAITAGIELAELKSTASRFVTEMQRDNLRFRLTGFYLDIYKYTNLRTVVEKNISQARKMLEDMNSRYEEGVALRNNITRYELLISNLELQLIRINNTLEILNNNLVITAGLELGTQIVPDQTVLANSLPTEPENTWQNEAMTNSPTVRLAGMEVDINRKAEDVVKSEFLPKIGIEAGWSINAPILVEVPPINRNLSYWYVGVGVSYNLASLYKSNKTLAKRKIATQHAIDKLDAARESLSLDVRADYIRYLESYEELKTEEKAMELADRNYTTVSTRYTAGMALITDLLDASNSKLDAEQRLVNARINIIYYYYKLLFTTGKI